MNEPDKIWITPESCESRLDWNGCLSFNTDNDGGTSFTRTDLTQAAVAAALEGAAQVADECIIAGEPLPGLGNATAANIAAHIRAMITQPQRDALQAVIDAAKAEARAEIYAKIEAMPRREEFLGGQRTQYVQLHEALAHIGAKP